MSVYSMLVMGLLVAMLLVWGCHPAGKDSELESNDPLELTWTGYDGLNQCDPCEAVYILNGSAIGKGEEGVNALIDRIAEASKEQELLVYPDKWVLSGLVGGSAQLTIPGDEQPDSVPFRKTPTAYQRIREAAKAKSVTIWYLGGAPGEYMLGTKDLRVQEDDGGVWRRSP
jgi:hypothetical protein